MRGLSWALEPPQKSWSTVIDRKRRIRDGEQASQAGEIVSKLRQVEVLVGQGMPRADAIRQIGVTEQTYYRWRKKYGGMGAEQLKELKRLQKENERLRRAVFRSHPRQTHPDRGSKGKLLSPARRRACIDRVRRELNVSERELAVFLVSTVPHNDACRMAVLMKTGWSRT